MEGGMNFNEVESKEVSTLIFKELKVVQENDKCFDCGLDDPQWASINNAVFLCLECCTKHRTLGLDISFIRSIVFDTWNERQLKCMSVGGNKKMNEYLSHYDLDNETLSMKYQSKAAEYYRKKIKACADGDDFNDPQPEYSVGREKIGHVEPAYPDIDNLNPDDLKSEFAVGSNGEEAKSEFAMDSNGEVLREDGAKKGDFTEEDKQRAFTLLKELLQTTIKVGEKGVEIVAFTGTKIGEKIDKNEKAKKYKDKGVEYAKKGSEYANVAVNYAVDAGKYVGNKGKEYGNKAYEYTQTEEFKDNWKKTVDTSKSMASKVGSYLSSLFNNANNQNNENGNQNEDNNNQRANEVNENASMSNHASSTNDAR